jgi:hypothetical protein
MTEKAAILHSLRSVGFTEREAEAIVAAAQMAAGGSVAALAWPLLATKTDFNVMHIEQQQALEKQDRLLCRLMWISAAVIVCNLITIAVAYVALTTPL